MSFSVPSSPAVSRSSKTHPVTPQRNLHRHSQSFVYNIARSPYTPDTATGTPSPYSFRSLSSAGSSVVTTPNSVGDRSFGGGKRLLSFSAASPEIVGSSRKSVNPNGSLADIAENWRERACENGIRVGGAVRGEEEFGDDEASTSFSEQAHDDENEGDISISFEEALLPPPLLSTHRRTLNRPRAQSHAPLPPSRTALPISPTVNRNHQSRLPISPLRSRLPPPVSPLRPRRISNQSQNDVTCTPPPNRTLARQLKLKGSFTDPPGGRRREAFGNIRPPNANISLTQQDTSLDLFDIDENDFESEYDYPTQASFDEDRAFQTTQNNAYNFQNTLSQLQHPQPHPIQPFQYYNTNPHPPTPFADPFHGSHVLSSIAESVEHHFHAQQPYLGYGQMHPGYHGPAYVPIPAGIDTAKPPFAIDTERKTPGGGEKIPKEDKTASGCSVCLSPNPSRLAILQPCKHPLCSGCLTSALNIVGEKDMECAVCRAGVKDFKLVNGADKKTTSTGGPAVEQGMTSPKRNSIGSREELTSNDVTAKGQSFLDPLFSSPGSDLESAFEFGFGDGLRASTPKLEKQPEMATRVVEEQSRKRRDNTVLRIDNVPWDITPPQIKRWLQQPVERVHVLLDAKGKTMSHAYVEVRDARIAGAILRGEASGEVKGRKKERSSVLGKGRRARGVTITRSGQEELMADLFPNWRGSFDGPRPSLARLDGDRVIVALEGGVLTETELSGILFLIREPDSHFLKVPSLPFHSLISILSKFPADGDSRVFWTTGIRDMLYDVAYAAVQVLLSRVDRDQPLSSADVGEYTMELVYDLIKAVMYCPAFTAQQLNKFSQLLESCSLSVPTDDEHDCPSSSPSGSGSSIPRTPGISTNTNFIEVNAPPVQDTASFGDLAREFGVEAQLVQALARRLAGLC
ncbi:hypothetical protein BD779DRAFT_1673142 [Infundibulicybe gibba]|nr:hypothetical protein BD779DRAFT_1673142 [Infundibulicybe gibba]